jgi:hypothetical protein
LIHSPKPDWSELEARARVRDEVMEFADAGLSEDVYPMGLRLHVETNDARILQVARSSFGRYPTPANVGKLPDVTMRLLVHDVDDGLPASERARTLFRLSGDSFYVTAGRDAVMAGDFARGTVFGFLPPSLVADSEFIRQHFVESGFYLFLRSHGFVGMHGAGLVKNGNAVMLRAQEGTGKSTLAFACIRRGYQLLGEDVVWVHWASQRQEWWGAPWTLNLLPDAARFFPALKDRETTVMPNGEHKIVVDLERIMPHAAVVTTPPGILVFLERHAGAASGTVRVTPQEAFQRFINPLGEPAGPSHVGYTTAAEQLLAKPSYVLRMGSDIESAVSALDTILENRHAH